MVGTCWVFTVALKDITNDLPMLTVGGRSLKKREKIKRRFCNFVQIYLDLKELSGLSVKLYMRICANLSNRLNFIFVNSNFYTNNTIYKLMVTAFFVYATLAISVTMLAFQMQLVEYYSIPPNTYWNPSECWKNKFFVLKSQCFHLDKSKHRSNWIVCACSCYDLDIWSNFHELWISLECYQTIWRAW